MEQLLFLDLPIQASLLYLFQDTQVPLREFHHLSVRLLVSVPQTARFFVEFLNAPLHPLPYNLSLLLSISLLLVFFFLGDFLFDVPELIFNRMLESVF